MYVLPFAALWGVFLAWPVGYGIYLSLFEWHPIKGSRFVGLGNYGALFRDARFLNAFANTFEFAAMAVPLILGLGLLFALMIWGLGRTRRGAGLVEAVLLFPYLLTVSSVAITWRWMFDPDFGLVTHAFEALKVPAPVFLTEPAWALPAIAFATAWWLTGYRMVVFQAGLGDIPQELFEVASIDGAKFRQKLLHIILPLLKPALLFSLVLTIISAFRTFGQVLMMTEGGPGRSTEVLALYLYWTAFEYFEIGKAAASGVVLLVLMFILTLIGAKLLGLKSELQ